MVDTRKTRRGVHVILPPPAPVPRFPMMPPPSSPTIDDAAPTQPWQPDPPTAPRTPPVAWAAPGIPWYDEAAARRNAPTVRPPSPAPSRVPAALHGFAAGLACGAIGLLVMRGAESPEAPAASVQRVSAGTIAGSEAAVRARVATSAASAPAPAASSATPVVRAEDLPRAATRVEDLPPVQRRGAWRRRP
jgi:hypothetical protein